MAESSLLALLFRGQSLRRKTKLVTRSRSRTRTLSDGREILRGAAYERRRKEVLKRDGGRCVECGSPHEVAVHHLRKRSLGRDDRPENLSTLCERCHRAQHEE